MNSYLIEKTKDQNLLIALVCAGAFIANLDATIVNIALPTLSAEFKVSPSVVSWTVLAYLLCEAGFMLPFGKLADIKGIKLVYQAGFVVFMIGSLLCGTSANINELIAFRSLQGLGGAMLFTVMMSFVPIYLPPERRIKAMGLVTTAAAAGVALGPAIGGWITAFIGWRWIFFVNIPFCLAAIVATRQSIPSAYPRTTDTRFDYLGAVISFAALVLFLFAVNMGLEFGWLSPVILSCFASSALLTVLFVIQQRKCDHPLLNLQLFNDKVMLFSMLAFSFSLITVGGVMFIFPFYLEEYRQLDTHVAGAIMMLPSLGQFIGPFTGGIVKRFGAWALCMSGMAVGVCSFFIFIDLGPASLIAIIVVSLGLFGLSQGLSKSPNTALIMSCAPPGGSSSVSSLMSLCRSLSMALGVLFFETIFSDSIPHHVSINNSHLAVITDSQQLAPGFLNAFLLGTAISVVAIVFMWHTRPRPHR